MNYQKIHDSIIVRSKTRALTGYIERHHVIPRCQGGSNNPDNLVELTPEEHFVIHQLLVKIYPNDSRLLGGLCLMQESKGNRIRNNKQFGWIRRRVSEMMTGQTKETSDRFRKISEKLKGRTKETHPYLLDLSVRMSLAMIGRTKENHEGIRRGIEKKAGRTKENHEGIRRGAEKLKGRTKENDENTKRRAEKLKGRTKENHEGTRRGAEKRTGRTKENDLTVRLRAERQRKLTDEQELYLVNYFQSRKMTFNQLHKHAIEIGFDVSYTRVVAIYRKHVPFLR